MMDRASADLAAQWRLDQDRRGLLPTTIQKRAGNLRAFTRWAEERGGTLDQGTEDVQRFLDGRDLSARTRYDWISTLHTFYVWAISQGLTQVDPTTQIARPRLRRSLPRPISENDLRVAIELAPQMIRSWLMLAAFAGLRCAEIADLRRDDVVDADGFLRVVGKGHKERIVPLHPAVLDSLRLSGLASRGHVFVRPQGGRWSAAALSRKGNLYLADIGVPATMHQLRHRFATRTYGHCHDIRVVQELLGHSSPTTTAGYAAFSPHRATEVVALLTLGD